TEPFARQISSVRLPVSARSLSFFPSLKVARSPWRRSMRVRRACRRGARTVALGELSVVRGSQRESAIAKRDAMVGMDSGAPEHRLHARSRQYRVAVPGNELPADSNI